MPSVLLSSGQKVIQIGRLINQEETSQTVGNDPVADENHRCLIIAQGNNGCAP